MTQTFLAIAPVITFSLHENWQFLDPRGGCWHPARVPGCIHADLLRNGLIPDPFWGSNELGLQWIESVDWQYVTAFELDAGFLEAQFIDLAADGLDTLATVVLNGSEVGRADNMFPGGAAGR